MGVSPSRLTFDPCQVPRWAWQEVKGEAMAVNEVDYTGVIVWTVGPGEVSTCVGGVVKRS